MAPLPQRKQYTYADILEWDESVQYELYDGVPVALAAPNIPHQVALGELFAQLHAYLRGKKCRVFMAPCDVRLFEKPGDRPEDIDIVVQPDLLVVCDPGKIGTRGIRGAPDLVIEILSESTRRLDRLTKLTLYQQAGVREYWMVDPAARTVSVYILKDNTYGDAAEYSAGSAVPVNILENCVIDLREVFPED